MKSNLQVSLFNINSIYPQKSGLSWHAEQRLLPGGSNLIEQTLSVKPDNNPKNSDFFFNNWENKLIV